jgi:hypothetical protein
MGLINGINYETKDLGTLLYGVNEINNHAYFRPKDFERGTFYEFLGVKCFKNLITKLMPNNKAGPNNYYIGNERTIDDLLNFEKYTRFNEKVHLLGSVFSLTGLLCNNYFSVISGLFFVLNLYCCLIQRYNRARVLNTLESKVL